MSSGTASAPRVLPARARRGYGLGSVATGSFGTVPGLLLLPYLTDHIGIGAGLAGVIVFAPKAWDVILNPIAGAVSDRSSNPGGRRRPFLIRFGLLLAACFALLFWGPTAPAALGAAWVALAFLACATAYAFFQVPYVAMPAELTDSYDERTRLMTWRVAILALAILVSGGLSPMIRTALGPTWGYRGVGIFVGLLIAFGAWAAWRATRDVPMASTPASSAGLAEQWSVLREDREFRLLLGTFMVQALATGAMLAGVDYVSRWVIGTPISATLLFVCFVAPALIVTPLWQSWGVARGKRSGYVLASALLGGGALVLVLMRSMPSGLVYLCVAVVGVGYAGAQMFPMAMLPDVASATERSRARVGVYTGVWTAGETLGLALGPALYGLVLAASGYASSTSGTVVQAQGTQSATAVSGIVLGFSLIPALLVALSFLTLLRLPPSRSHLPPVEIASDGH